MPCDTRNPDTPSLLERFRSGDERAYALLFTRYRLRLLGFIRKHCDPSLEQHVSPDDILQETHVEAIRCLDRFTYQRELAFFLWLCGIAIRRIRNHCQRLQRKPPHAALLAEPGAASSQGVIDSLRCARQSPEEDAMMAEELDLLAAALERIPEIYREAVMLRFIEGLDNRSAASRAGVSYEGFRPRVRRGLEKLKRSLDDLIAHANEAR